MQGAYVLTNKLWRSTLCTQNSNKRAKRAQKKSQKRAMNATAATRQAAEASLSSSLRRQIVAVH